MRTNEFVSVKQLGDAEVAVYHVGNILSSGSFGPGKDWRTHDADADDEGHAILGLNGMIVRLRDHVIAIDPTTLVTEDDNAPFAKVIVGPTIDDAFEVLALDPATVTHVLVTHGHTDHFFGVLQGDDADGRLRFPNAEHWFPALDWEYFVTSGQEWPPDHLYSRIPRLLRPVERAGRLRLVKGDHEVAPGVTLLHTAGETAGHQVVRIETGDRPVYWLGDLVHLPIEFQELDWTYPNRDPEIVRDGRIRILTEAAASGATVVYAHGRFPAWGAVQQVSADRFRWQYAANGSGSG
jgi:glyoxylase-like metal-dependent hydrolase (beta-lactamase superfamily II)